MSDKFLKFIDSHAIRTHIKTYLFTPAEQAVLIAQGCTRPVDEIIAVLEHLYDNYSAEEFRAEKVGMFGENEMMTFRDRLAYYIKGLKNSFALRSASQGYVFIAADCEENFEYSGERYYTSYAAAYEDIASRYKEHSANFPEVSYEYRIRIMPEGSLGGIDHYFDNGLNLVSADPVLPLDDDLPCVDISQYYVWLPLPFKKGDIVKVTYRCGYKFMTQYAVFAYPDDESDERFLQQRNLRRQNGDSSDMGTILEYFVPSDDSPLGGCFESEHESVLNLDYPDESDIGKIDYATIMLAAALDDKYNDYHLIDLLKEYSQGAIARGECCLL